MATRTPKYKNLIICLYGRGDSGKTSTLLELSEVLRQKSTVYTELKANAGSSDKRIIVKAMSSYIGIGTYGDTDALIEDNFKELMKHQNLCRIILTASREKIVRGNTYGTSLSAYLGHAAIWNIAKCWQEKRNGNIIINVTGVGELLYHLVDAIRTKNHADKDIV